MDSTSIAFSSAHAQNPFSPDTWQSPSSVLNSLADAHTQSPSTCHEPLWGLSSILSDLLKWVSGERTTI
jgi:hypothetical protein